MRDVTVFIPAYNASAWIEQTLQSVLEQTYQNFELLVIDDGSTDDTAELVAAYSDPRIRLVRNETNKGIAATRNRALSLCQTEWLACLDADDIAVPERLAIQLSYLAKHPEVVVLGGMGTFFGQMSGRASYPVGTEGVQARLPFDNPFLQNTVVLNVPWLRARGIRYREDFQYCEDYDMWAQIAEAGGLMTNLDDTLVHYRVHAGSTSRSKRAQQECLANRVRLRLLHTAGCPITPEELSFLDTYQFTGSHWASRQACAHLRALASRLRKCKRFGSYEIGRFLCSALPRPANGGQKALLAFSLILCLPREGSCFVLSYLLGRG